MDLTRLRALRPMQAIVESVYLPNGPALALIKDATGSSKTEAALVLAHRMSASARARRLFFALPAIAAANAMLARVNAAIGRLFAGGFSLALAPGQAWPNKSFRQKDVGAEDGPAPETGEISCTRWFADD